MSEIQSLEGLEQAGAPHPGQRCPPQRILVVEDDTIMRRMITTLLVGARYHVDAAEDGAVAWEILQANTYDLMITDNQMPRLVGLDLVAKLRAAHMTLPVVLATGQLPADELAQNPSLQIAAVLLKPFSVAALLGTVNNALLSSGQGDDWSRIARIFDRVARASQNEEADYPPADYALKASEVRYRRLFETAQDGILILNADTGQIDDVNPFLVDLLGYTREQFLGYKLWEIGPFKDTKASQAGFTQLQREAYVRYEDLPLETIDGKPVNVEFVSNVYQANGSKVIQCNIRDITERKKAEDKRKENSRKLEAFSRRMAEAQETERRNIARKFHDEIGRALTFVQLNLMTMLKSPNVNGMASSVEESLNVVGHVLAQVRDFSLDMRPPILDQLGLELALRWYALRQAALVNLKVELDSHWLEQRLDPVTETECFRVAQEALTNVTRHARASTVAVNLHTKEDRLHLSVRDDGVGFDVASAREQAVRGASMGLLSMEERAALAGGGLEFKSTPGKGTEVQAWFPLKRQTSPSALSETMSG